MFRRPVIDEYDFYAAQYLAADGEVSEVRIEVVLTELAPEALRRFRSYLRRWSATDEPAVATPDQPGGGQGEWCLPLAFIGRFNPDEDDFEGFTREDKRLCLYLRATRTGSRALSSSVAPCWTPSPGWRQSLTVSCGSRRSARSARSPSPTTVRRWRRSAPKSAPESNGS
ncbi:hypothetical protein GCM10027575_83590 [Phytohabitans suffuscus]